MASRASRRLVPQEPAAEQEASDGAGLPEADALSTDDSCDTARRSSSAVSRAPRSPHAGDKRPGTDAADDAVERIEGIVGGYHITDGACENALQPCDSTPRDTKVSVALIARPAERPDLPSDLPGAPKRQKRTRRRHCSSWHDAFAPSRRASINRHRRPTFSASLRTRSSSGQTTS